MDNICNQRRMNMLYNIPLPRVAPVNPYINDDGSSTGITQDQINMRRKVEILKYNNQPSQTNKLTRAEIYAQRTSGRYNIRIGTDLTSINCPNDSTIPTLSTSSDIPGNPVILYEDPNIPLYNYKPNTTGFGDQIYDDTTELIFNPYSNAGSLVPALTDIAQLVIRKRILTDITSFNYRIPISLSITGSNVPISMASTLVNISLSCISVDIYYNNSQFAQPTTYSLNTTGLSGVSIVMNATSDISQNSIVPDTFDFKAVLYIGFINMENIRLTTEPYFIYTFKINVPYVSTIPNTFGEYIENSIICNVGDNSPQTFNCDIDTTVVLPGYSTVLFEKL